jgi:hypothetical protein
MPGSLVVPVRKLWSTVYVCPAKHQHRTRRAAEQCPATKKAAKQ